MQLFVFRVSRNFHDLHAVSQGTRNTIDVIGRRNKEDFRQILGHLHIMVHKTTVLFRVQHLQQSRRNVPFDILSGLVYFIQKHQRIGYFRGTQRACQVSGQRADICAPVPSDLCFIIHAAQADPDIFLVQRPGHRLRNRSLACTGRSHKAEDGAFSLICQNPDRKEF